MLTEYYLSRIYLLRVTLVCIVCWYLSPNRIEIVPHQLRLGARDREML